MSYSQSRSDHWLGLAIEAEESGDVSTAADCLDISIEWADLEAGKVGRGVRGAASSCRSRSGLGRSRFSSAGAGGQVHMNGQMAAAVPAHPVNCR